MIHIKKEKFKYLLYDGNKYEGIFLEGNQYLLSNSASQVLIIDMLSEELGVDKKNTRIQLDKEPFIELVTHTKQILDWLKENR